MITAPVKARPFPPAFLAVSLSLIAPPFLSDQLLLQAAASFDQSRMTKDVRSTENGVRKKLYGGATLDDESFYTDMKRLLIIAAIAFAALTMVSWGVAHRHPNLTESPDRNVPGATTGLGRSSVS